MLTLLWGLTNDPVLSALADELSTLEEPFVWLDQRRVSESSLSLTADPVVSGAITSDDVSIDLSEVTAVYPRPHDTRRVPSVANAGPESATWARAVAFDQAVLTWLELTPALVVNRPSAMASNGSKPLQLTQIHRAGFHTPKTLVTNDPTAAAAFRRRHGDVIYKSVSGIRSKVARLRPGDERLADVKWCPTQFQRYIPGREFRVHVVGEEVFGSEVVSDADDYRYVTEGQTSPKVFPASLPPDIADRSRKMAEAMGLHFAGLDLRLATDGRWYCLEANPSPAFTYYEQSTEQPIGRSVARLLAAG